MHWRNFIHFCVSLLGIFVGVRAVPALWLCFVALSLGIVGMRLAEWMMNGTRRYFLNPRVSPNRKALFITGCDSGFGHMVAQRMDILGYKVFAGCLYSQGQGASSLKNNCSSNLKVVPLDVTSDQSIQEAKDFVMKNLKDCELWAIVNNAGVIQVGEIDWCSIEDFQKVYDVNALGILRVTKAFLPLVKKSKGRIVNSTSINGRFTTPGYVGYCMSKHAAVSLTIGLRMELAKWGIKVSSIEPYFYSTPLTNEQIVKDASEKIWQKVPEDIRNEYGDIYFEKAFQGSLSLILKNFNNPNISEVVECFEDAITAEEPLPTYFPTKFSLKILLKGAFDLPSAVLEWTQRLILERGYRPYVLENME